MDVLTNKSYKNYNRLSRYGNLPTYYNKLDRKNIHGTYTPLKHNTTYSLYQVKSGESYDLISLKAYNNPTYYWVICDFNDIKDPFINPAVGQYLKVPILSNIEFLE